MKDQGNRFRLTAEGCFALTCRPIPHAQPRTQKIVEKIQKIDELPSDEAQYLQWVGAGQHMEFLKQNAVADEIVIFGSGPYTFIHSIVVPDEAPEAASRDDLLRWSCNPYVSIASYVSGGGGREVWIEWDDHHRVSEALDLGRDLILAHTFEGWSGDGRDYIEVNQEYTHLTVSRSGLVNGFNHYLREGSEFDWHVLHHLHGPEGQALMAADGQRYLIALPVPGDAALASCNRYGMPTEDFPDPVSDLFRVWSYWLGYPDYRASRLKLDCGLVVSDTVPASWIDRVEKIDII